MTCPNHPEGQVCATCLPDKTTDGAGFPHPRNIPKGSVAVRRCPSCGSYVRRLDWNMETWSCDGCAPRAA